ncbi:peptidoglycan-binding protein [Streptomyces cyaneofuscatus]|uniref:peptidoglycan-binding protein n=1 Tax=Streptomyces cyaneofuscatus TaxID=66883 RepID=UPI0036389B28
MTTPIAADVLKVAKAEVGTQETRANGRWVNDSKYNKWYGRIPGYGRDGMDYPWCAVWVAWVADKAGAKALYPRTASCAVGVAWFRKAGRFSEYPAIGAQVFFGAGGGTHTGIVYDYDDTWIYTYEGNTNTSGSAEGDGVYARKRMRRDSYVYGYGYPAFAEGIRSADPAWASEAPKPAAKPKPKPTPKPSYAPFPGKDWFRKAPNSALVKAMGKRLVAEGYGGYKVGPGNQWTDADRRAFAWWQKTYSARKHLGWSGSDVDGWPGKTSWDALKVPKG